jgi:hypothetical protein
MAEFPLRTFDHRDLQNVPPANVPSNPVQSVQSIPVQLNSLIEANNRNVKMPAVSNYNCTVFYIILNALVLHCQWCVLF